MVDEVVQAVLVVLEVQAAVVQALHLALVQQELQIPEEVVEVEAI